VSIFFTSWGEGKPLKAHDFGKCCGRRPDVLVWPTHDLTAVYCRNPRCEWHSGLLAHDVDIARKWEAYRHGVGEVAA
jgi:hypothetical protein